ERAGLSDGSFKVVSDGAKMQSTLSNSEEQTRSAANTPKSFHEVMTKSFSRCGCYVIMNLMGQELPRKESPEVDIEKVLVVSDFKLGPREKVGQVDAQAIHYRLDFQGHERFAATVWLDLTSELPVKHYLEPAKKGRLDTTITTTYSGLSVDQKVDEKTFTVPK